MKGEYTVFIDESFDRFMNLQADDGWFCYGAFMIPTERLADLARFHAALFENLQNEYKKATGFSVEGEFKSSHYGKIPRDVRVPLAPKISYFLAKNRCFLAGFYTTVKSLLFYNLRSDLAFHNVSEFPALDPNQLEKQKQELLKDKQAHPGESKLLNGLFMAAALIPFNWLGKQGFKFRIQYDPRNKKEDRVLVGSIDDFLPKLGNVWPDLANVYVGTDATKESKDCPGLMSMPLTNRREECVPTPCE
jgi:hypothetical protein